MSVCCDARIAVALERIADSLERLMPAPAEAAVCEHPEDARDYRAATMGHIRWTCACGYTYDAKGAA